MMVEMLAVSINSVRVYVLARLEKQTELDSLWKHLN